MANCREEIWANIPIEGFENYQVSNLGRVRNKFGKINTQNVNQSGYYRVYLTHRKKKNTYVRKQWLVSRLVLMTFSQIDNADNLEVNHISGDKSDNSIDNLEWVTHRENMYHYYRVLRPTKRK